MTKKHKKGFTLVELVIIIAVIAILAAVLIPTFAGIVKKAKISADTQIVKNINTILSTEEATEGKPETLYDAVKLVEQNGYGIEKLTPTTNDYNIVWDQETNRLALLNKKGEVVYKDGESELSAGYKLWAFYKEVPSIEDQKYSIYLKGKDFKGTVETKVGVDVGANKNVDVEYSNDGKAQDVLLRTDGGDITIDGKRDSINHYGIAKNVEIVSVADHSYTLFGTANSITVEKGNINIEEGALVSELTATSAEVSLNILGFVSNLTTGDADVKISKTANVVVKDGEPVEGGSNIIKVKTYNDLQRFANSSTVGVDLSSLTIQLQNDISLAERTFVPFGNSEEFSFAGTIDGNGHKITGLSDPITAVTEAHQSTAGIMGYPMALIAYAKGNVTIKNLTIEANINYADGEGAAAFIAFYNTKLTTGGQECKITFENCTAEGNITAQDKVGGFIGSSYRTASVSPKMYITFKDCVNNANLKATATGKNLGRIGGFIGTYTNKASFGSLTFENCENNGTVEGGSYDNLSYAGSLIGYVPSSNRLAVEVSGFTNNTSGLPLVGYNASNYAIA